MKIYILENTKDCVKALVSYKYNYCLIEYWNRNRLSREFIEKNYVQITKEEAFDLIRALKERRE